MIESVYICLEIGATFHKPGREYCASFVALNGTLNDIAKSCKWKKNAEEDEYIFNCTRETTKTITCENEREQKYLKLEKGNTELHLGTGCQRNRSKSRFYNTSINKIK